MDGVKNMVCEMYHFGYMEVHIWLKVWFVIEGVKFDDRLCEIYMNYSNDINKFHNQTYIQYVQGGTYDWF